MRPQSPGLGKNWMKSTIYENWFFNHYLTNATLLLMFSVEGEKVGKILEETTLTDWNIKAEVARFWGMRV